MYSLSNTTTTADTTASKGSIFFLTLGCAKNEVDTDRMRALLENAGYLEVAEVVDADAVIINTCSFLEAATVEGIEATLELADLAADGIRERPIIMCGCIPSRYGSGLEEQLPEVSAFVRHDEEDGIVEVVEAVLEQTADPSSKPVCGPDEALRTVQGASAFIKISEGCSRFCSFCAIPYIRGPYWSRTEEEILSEVRALKEGGVREFVLIGQDTGIWGCDLEGTPTLAHLLRAVAEEVSDAGGWVRVLYLQPEGMTDELISTIRDVPEVLPYIDIPIQHSSARILKEMNRSGSEEELRALFAKLRNEIPGMIVRSTAMAGFPTETDEEHEALYAFLAEQAFDYCSVFAYSREEDTVAYGMDGQIDEETKLERTQRLQDLAERLGFAATAAHVGETADVIIDGVEETDDGIELIGHAWFQAPDSDGAVHIPFGEASVGEVVRCTFTDSFCYELIGEITA
ncbi:MAG: 30S ribosomal protein S12 methylthiotransferase RimO [Atopobiaceae bacterium]|nr:30S ribosomal protein S12 methylthiotransferase RimO [Atopobiaceae bacterium]